MTNFSLVSALIGGLITAVLSYIAWTVQTYLLKRSERKRVAFFYLVKISEILGIMEAAKFVFKDEISQMKSQLGNEKYAVHMMCVALSELFSGKYGLTGDKEKSLIMSLGDAMNRLNVNKEECFGYKVDNEIVSKFPNKAILNYHFFISCLRDLQSYLSGWMIAVEKVDFRGYSADYLYNQITCGKTLLVRTKALVDSLAEESGIKSTEVNEIVSQQFKEYSKTLLEYKRNKQITDVILESFNKAKSVPKQEAVEQMVK